MTTTYPMTVKGAEELRAELRRLKSKERPRIIEAIAVARAHGDLKENGEYHAAREQQSFVEGRIMDLEARLSNAQVIDLSKVTNTGKVVFGSFVKLHNLDSGQEVTYQIVGELETDLKALKISYSSPLGKTLIGKQLNDVVTVKAPGGTVEYEIIGVEYI
jgi:transcription elongation factor GreA